MERKNAINSFIEWTKIKIKIHFSERIIYFKEGEIWWANIGQNIGREQNGKNRDFERPILVLKKFNAETFWELPISTRIKTGKYYFVFKRAEKEFSINLSQLRLVSSKRLLRLVGNLSGTDFTAVKNLIRSLL